MRRPALLAWLALAACQSPHRTTYDAPGLGFSLPDVRPGLAEIFLEPPLYGVPPRALSLSADGRWLLFSWKPVVVDEEGKRALAEGSGRRLLDLRDLDAGPGSGLPLEELLPPPSPAPPDAETPGADEVAEEEEGESEPSDPRIASAVWSESGARLAVARDFEVVLVDPARGTSALLVRGAPRPEAEEPEDTEDTEDTEDAEDTENTDAESTDPESAPPATDEPRLGRVRSLAFEEDDTLLRVDDGEESFLFPVPPPGAPIVELGLADAAWLSRELVAKASTSSWSEDRTVAFTTKAPIVRVAEGEPEPEVWLADEGRAVVLEGYADIEEPGSPRLSPDGRFVVAREEELDEAPEPTLVPDYLTERVSTRETRRRLADDGPAPTRLWVWDTHTGARVEAQLAGDELAWMRHEAWAPQPRPDSPARFLVRRTSLDHRTREVWCWTEGSLALLHTERDERWVGGPSNRVAWTKSGDGLVFVSECTPGSTTPGRAQVFALDPAGGPARQLTEVAGEVSSFRVLDDERVLFTASEETPYRRVLGLVDPSGGDARALPAPPGWNELALPDSGGARFVFAHEELLQPAELWLAADGEARQLTRTTPEELGEVTWIRPVLFETEASDGTTLRAHVFLPAGTSLEAPDAPRAAVVFVHGAGYLQNVTDSMTRYPLNLLFHSRLASLGYVVVEVDYRGSAGYGGKFRTDVQYHLGGLDLTDIHDVLDELAERGLVDPERIGLYGGSYGGFLTLMALFTAPDRWAVGAALRSVTDWRTYHPGYTQPRLGRPSTHAEAYERSSPIDHVDKLEDPLLVLHGLVDTNVFAQDSIRLIEALIDRGSDFDAMLYPSQGHGFSDGPHWLDEYRRIERFLLGHLGPPLTPAAVSP